MSGLGSIVPLFLMVIGLYGMGRMLLTVHEIGLPVIGPLLAMLLFFFLTLQGLVNVVLPRGTRRLYQTMTTQAVRVTLSRTFR